MADPGDAEVVEAAEATHEAYVATPTLIRAARAVYARAIRAELRAVGADALPNNGAFVLAGIYASAAGYTVDGLREELAPALGMTGSAADRVVDALLGRGYLVRIPDPEGRRPAQLELTGPGHEVLAATARGVEAVDRLLAARITREQIDALRVGLIELGRIKLSVTAGGDPEAAGEVPGRTEERSRRRARALRQFSPIFPVADLGAALDHYAALGFTTLAYEGGTDYGFAERDGVGLHLAAEPGAVRAPGAAYLYVRDADALHGEWARPGIGGHTYPVGPTPYGLREGSHVDPDGNLIRFGSAVPEAPGAPGAPADV